MSDLKVRPPKSDPKSDAQGPTPKALLFRRPVGGFVLAVGGELAGLGAVGEHGPDLARAVAGGLEDDVATVGRPTGAFVAGAGIGREINDLLGIGFHDVDVVVAIRAAPAEGEDLAVGRPCGIDQVALVGDVEQAHVGAVGVHHIELGNAAAIADEDYALAGLGVPGGRRAAAVGESEALRLAAARVRNVELGIAGHGGGEHDLRAVGRPSGGAVGAGEAGERDDFAGVHGVHADFCGGYAVVGLVAGEGDAGSVGRPAGREGDRAERGERVLVGAVVIHDPDFFGAGARADEGDLRRGDAGKTAGEFADDFVGELVGEFADLLVGGSAAIDFADDGLGGGIVDVVEPGLDGDFGGGFGDVAEGDVAGFDVRVGPSGVLKFGRLGERLRGIEAGADKFDDAAEGEVVADDLGELLGVRLGGVGARAEIGDGDAEFLDAEACAGAEPGFLLLGGRGL